MHISTDPTLKQLLMLKLMKKIPDILKTKIEKYNQNTIDITVLKLYRFNINIV